QAVHLCDSRVGHAVCRRDAHRAGAEVHLHASVGDDAHVNDRTFRPLHVEGLTDVLPVTLVVGMDGDAGVAELGLGTAGGHFERTVTDRVERGLALLVVRLVIGDGGPQGHVPVDDAL